MDVITLKLAEKYVKKYGMSGTKDYNDLDNIPIKTIELTDNKFKPYLLEETGMYKVVSSSPSILNIGLTGNVGEETEKTIGHFGMSPLYCFVRIMRSTQSDYLSIDVFPITNNVLYYVRILKYNGVWTSENKKINVLDKNNSEEYTPTKDYHPATKKYVDDSVGNVSDEKIAEAVGTYIEAHPIEETDPTVPDWAKQPEKPTYTASEVVADAEGTAESKVSEHNVALDAHNDIRLLVQGLTERLNALADSDDTTLDQMSEIVAYIKSNKSLIDAITTSKVNVSDIIDNLTTNVSNKPLSAAQGVKLKALIDAIAVPTKLSELENDSGYAKTTDIPEKLPNPQKLTFAGAVTAEYDGSGAVTVTIPEGSGGSGGTVRIEKLSTDTAVELEPNKLYIFPEMAELTITLAEPSDTSIVSEYHFVFQSGATATTLSIPDAIKIPSGFSVDVNKIYEISILEGCLCAQSWEVTASAS